ncbi:MAG: 4-(cytidine 5'-diphospho)-2-C-methyl-D-erythritol kinase [Eubacteriales bacterium]|nr:4-(cytidine 5'-diphospho)-2-C-methyl-D-erythritol kinase [Eubacteriales bacterium]
MKQAAAEAHAKINLTLDVTGKRSDGYHDVCMVMQSIGIHDIVTVCTGTGTGIIELKTTNSAIPTDCHNLAYRAAALFLEKTQMSCDGIRIEIEKNNPIAAGLAGGSTDAAAVLMLLNHLYETQMNEKECMELGLQIGADVPFCLTGGTMLAEGIGEKLTKLEQAPQYAVVLCKPPFAVSTPAIYKAIDSADIMQRPDTSAVLRALKASDAKAIAGLVYNVMQPITADIHPEVNEICAFMKENGALGASMSGSGPSVFGLFTDNEAAQHTKDLLAQQYEETFLTDFCHASLVKL